MWQAHAQKIGEWDKGTHRQGPMDTQHIQLPGGSHCPGYVPSDLCCKK